MPSSGLFNTKVVAHRAREKTNLDSTLGNLKKTKQKQNTLPYYGLYFVQKLFFSLMTYWVLSHKKSYPLKEGFSSNMQLDPYMPTKGKEKQQM